ncbi:MAG: NAD(P)H-dependent oxidoreductase subunit E [Gemmatimonadaceae bacterium]|nr:NAD(P)H-dependent oxidoreductase subunit E [Gemmatimonadaceae bacterium]
MSHGPSASGGAVAHSAHGHHDEPYVPVFTSGSAPLAKLDDILSRYPTRQAGLLPALWIVQDERGWISEHAMKEVGDVLGLTAAYVKGVVSFYTMYHQHPVGQYFIQVCTTSCCNCMGAEDVVKAFLEKTGCGELGLTSADGKYTVIEVECLGACGFATPIMINNDFVDSVSVEKVPEILKKYC